MDNEKKFLDYIEKIQNDNPKIDLINMMKHENLSFVYNNNIGDNRDQFNLTKSQILELNDFGCVLVSNTQKKINI